VQVVTAAALAADTSTGPLAGAADLDEALVRLRGDAVAPPEALPGLGDEAWVVDTGVRTVWARQGEILIGVAVARSAGPDDVAAAQGIVRVLLGATASLDA
jgi:hypothetical protein